MPIHEMTQKEVEDWLGKGIVLPGPKRMPQSNALKSDVCEQSIEKSPEKETAKRSGDIVEQSNQAPEGEQPVDKFDPNAPETEAHGIRAEVLRRLKVRGLLKMQPAQVRALSQLHTKKPSEAGGSVKQTECNDLSTSTSVPISCLSGAHEFGEPQMDLLAECILDLHSQLQEWLGFDIPTEGTEDYETWRMKISLIEQVKSISDVYSLCECGDFKLPSVLEDETNE
jgi:hypothetical protein